MRQLEDWIPKTALGKMVIRGEVTSMAQALRTGLPLREPEIVDTLLPEMDDEVLDVNMVQRMTDSGRRINFVITVVVGNGDGYVGLGRVRGKEVGPAIRKAFDIAKLNIIEVKRGCGSWECGCFRPHTLPFKVTGKSGSVEVTLKPAPRGVGMAVADVVKSVVRLSGIEDVWGFSRGHTKTTVNYAYAAYDALRKTMEFKVTPGQLSQLHILSGPVVPFEVDLTAVEQEEEAVRAEEPAKPAEGGEVPPKEPSQVKSKPKAAAKKESQAEKVPEAAKKPVKREAKEEAKTEGKKEGKGAKK